MNNKAIRTFEKISLPKELPQKQPATAKENGNREFRKESHVASIMRTEAAGTKGLKIRAIGSKI